MRKKAGAVSNGTGSPRSRGQLAGNSQPYRLSDAHGAGEPRAPAPLAWRGASNDTDYCRVIPPVAFHITCHFTLGEDEVLLWFGTCVFISSLDA